MVNANGKMEDGKWRMEDWDWRKRDEENVENVCIQFARLTKPLARHLERFRISLTDESKQSP